MSKLPKAAVNVSLPTSRAPGPADLAVHGSDLTEASKLAPSPAEPEVKQEATPTDTAAKAQENESVQGDEARRKRGRPPKKAPSSSSRSTPPGRQDTGLPLKRRSTTNERVSHTIRFQPELKLALQHAAFELKMNGFELDSQDAIVNEATRKFLQELGFGHLLDSTQPSELASA